MWSLLNPAVMSVQVNCTTLPLFRANWQVVVSQDLLCTVIDTVKYIGERKGGKTAWSLTFFTFIPVIFLPSLNWLLMILVVNTFLLRCDPVYRSCLTSLNPVITLVTYTVQICLHNKLLFFRICIWTVHPIAFFSLRIICESGIF